MKKRTACEFITLDARKMTATDQVRRVFFAFADEVTGAVLQGRPGKLSE